MAKANVESKGKGTELRIMKDKDLVEGELEYLLGAKPRPVCGDKRSLSI